MTDSISGAALREMMRRVPSPVTVITTTTGGEIRGMTAGSFTSICLEPPLVSFNVTRTSGMYRVITDASYCAIHLLDEHQVDMARLFARPDLEGADQFVDVSHSFDEHHLPIIEETCGVLKAELIAEHEAGDSAVFIGRVTATRKQREGHPLLYYKSSYRSIGGSAEQSAQVSVSTVGNSSSSDSPDTPTPNNAKS